MTVGGEYDSPQKQAVRERLWDTAVAEALAAQNKTGADLRVLDLPGAKCIYLKHLIDRFGVLRENIVAVEREEEPFLAIHHFLGGRGIVRHGSIEDLCESAELGKYFPMDIVNLDFCGQGFIFPDLGTRSKDGLEYQRRWNCINQVMEFNRARGQSVWFLLLTLACNRNNAAGRAYLQGQLAELCRLTGVAKDPVGWKDSRLIQEVVPKVVAEEALHHGYIPSTGGFDSYGYVQAGHQYEMVAWKFRLERNPSQMLGQKISKPKQLLEEFCREYFATDAKVLDL